MKHLNFESTPTVAMEGLLGDILQKLGGLFKSEQKKLELQNVPRYEAELRKLKDVILTNYASLGDAQKFVLKSPDLTITGHSISPYLSVGKFHPNAIDVPALIHEDVIQLRAYWPKLQAAASHYLEDVNKLILDANKLSIDERSYEELNDKITARNRQFTMPLPPQAGNFLNLATPSFIRGAFDPTRRLHTPGLTPEANAKNLGDALPVLSHEQIVNFAHAMIEIVNFLIEDLTFHFTPRPPYYDDVKVAKLHQFEEETDDSFTGPVWDVMSCLPQHHFVPATIWSSHVQFLSDCLLAMDRWISRSIR